MKILFDLAACQSKIGMAHGGGKYGVIVLLEMIRQDFSLECVYNSSLTIRDDVKEVLDYNNIILHDISRISIEEFINTHDFDVFYSARINIKKDIKSRTKICYTLHGLREIEMPRDWSFLLYKTSVKAYMKKVVILLFNKMWKGIMIDHNYKRIHKKNFYPITVSQHSKFAIKSYNLSYKDRDVKVFYSPSTCSSNSEIKACDKYGDYIFIVSAGRHEKNALRAIKALDDLFTNYPEYRNYKVVLTGASANSFFYKFKNIQNFIFLGYVSEDELEALYCGAKLFVYISLNEGFGYPPLEAMRFGVPVIASPFTSISEICDNAAMYCNPYDIKEIEGRVLRMLSSPQTMEEYSNRGKKRYKEVLQKQNNDLIEMIKYISSLN